MITLNPIDGFVWLPLTLGPLLFLQPRLHHEVQALFLLLTRSPRAAVTLFAALFFPGVLLHEASHYLMARLLDVPTGRFSLVPRELKNGQLQLGFVEVAKADVVRESLIGAAPLVAGSLFITYAGLAQLEFDLLWRFLADGDAAGLPGVLAALPANWSAWMWLYLTIAVSSTMMPSASDRRAWVPMGVILALGVGLLLWAGGGGWLVESVGPALNNALRAMSVTFGIALGVHLVILIPVALLRRVVGGMMGVEVETQKG